MTDVDTVGVVRPHILVTGATSGIGRAAAVLLSQRGARLFVTGRDAGRLTETLEQLVGEGHNGAIVDLNNLDEVAGWVKSIASEWGAFNGIFHAAGAASLRPAKMLKQQHLDDLMACSVDAAFGIFKAASNKSVLTDGGSVVVMSSVAGLRGQAGMAAYAATKGAIDSAVRSMACEFAPRKIRVNSIAAGAVKSEMHDRIVDQLGATGVDAYESHHLLGFGEPMDVARAAAFLLSNEASWITGTTLVVDGGYTVR